MWSRFISAFPSITQFIEDLCETHLAEPSRVFLVRLKGPGAVYEHVDTGSYYESRDRFYVLLHAESPLELIVSDERLELTEGNLCCFDNQQPHTLKNLGASSAVFLMIDMLPLTVRPKPHSPYKHFERVGTYDISPFLKELQSNFKMWDLDTSRQDNIRVQRETSNIPLRGAAKPIPQGINARDVHPSRDTQYAAVFPLIYRWVTEFAQAIDGDLGRLTIVRLNPHGTVHPHIDEGEYYLSRDRYHLVLISPSGSEMIIGDETVYFQEGELWWFDNKADHKAHNNSEVGRVHVIFDVKPRRRISEMGFASTTMVDARAGSSKVAETASRSEHDENATSLVSAQADPTPFGSDLAHDIQQILLEQRGGGNAALSAIGSLLHGRYPSLEMSLCLRNQGVAICRIWKNQEEFFIDPIPTDSSLPLTEASESDAFDSMELFLVRRVQDSNATDLHKLNDLGNASRGIVGLEFLDAPRRNAQRWSPFDIIAINRSIPELWQDWVNKFAPTESPDLFRILHGDQFFITSFAEPGHASNYAPTPTLRARSLVSLETITHQYLIQLERLLGDFLVQSVHETGKISYLVEPSIEAESDGIVNHLRLWMASLALCKIAKYRDDPKISEKAVLNIRYNLQSTYRLDGLRGIIDDNGKIKLGAMAFAVLSLREHVTQTDFTSIAQSLLDSIDSMWQSSGRFQTFLSPPNRDDCHNFYPGETLLLWAEVYRENRDPQMLARFAKSVEYYQAWHQSNRNPAFVPWHTQAYWLMWSQLVSETTNGDHPSVEMNFLDSLRDAVFQMNDWLIEMQQWDDAPAPDMMGRFYSPDNPYGPPHASSTAVYLEGLIDAYQLARRVGDQSRQWLYRTAVQRGFRSIAQLTIKEDSDAFYVRDKKRFLGGITTTEYDNRIRIDNVQHSLLAVIKAIRCGILQ